MKTRKERIIEFLDKIVIDETPPFVFPTYVSGHTRKDHLNFVYRDLMKILRKRKGDK